jgi:hypothetical protein
MQGLAAANANSATPFTTAGRIEQVGTRGGAAIADHFFACEGNVPLLTVKRRVPVVAARGNVSGFVCWHIGEHSLPTSGTAALDGEIAVLVMNALWPEPEATVDAGGVRCLGSTCRRSVGPDPPLVTRFRRAAIG